jgi:hypothetical protein
MRPGSTPGLSRRRFRGRKFRCAGHISDVGDRKRLAARQKFALYRMRGGIEIDEGGLSAVAIRIVALAAQDHVSADQCRERRPVIVRVWCNDFDAGEADVTAIFETERPRIGDGAHDAVTLDVELTALGDGRCGYTERYSTEQRYGSNTPLHLRASWGPHVRGPGWIISIQDRKSRDVQPACSR